MTVRARYTLVAAMIAALVASLVAVSTNDATADGRGNPPGPPLELGLERLLDRNLDWLAGKQVGLVTNPTGVDSDLEHGVDLLIDASESHDFEVTALYGPEHGVRGGAEAGEYVESYTDERTGLPVYSLYGETQKPSAAMLEDVDVLLFDIQDIGTRFYTYIWTMYYVMEAAAEEDKEMIVLDRPNPLGDRIEGPMLDPELSSFVGLKDIPLRHGMTVGELAKLFEGEFLDDDLELDLRVSEMHRYQPRFFENFWGLEWVLPSPNIPTHESALVYPGTGLVESLNVSEGRGTTKPFEWVGAPWFDDVGAQELADDLNDRDLPGVTFRPMFTTPTMSWQEGEFSGGVELHVTDAEVFESVRTGLHVLDALFEADETQWREYEPGWWDHGCDEDTICWIERLGGDRDVRAQLEAGVDPDEIVAGYQDEVDEFDELAEQYRIYR
jgi:uncharacterized protein YbbC (DUF1343 family)